VKVLAHLWSLADCEPAALGRVTETGPRHALPAVFDVTELAVGAVGAAQLAAAMLMGGSSVPPVTIDRRHSAIAFRSERLSTIDGRPPPPAWDEASGYYPTGDGGLIQLHCNFPHHRAGALAELGIDDPGDDRVRTAISSAVAERDAAELEQAMTDRGLCAAMLRTPTEWRSHPQGAAVADLPVVEIERVGDGPARAVGDVAGTGKVLAGVRVADLSRVIAGPVCGRVLAAHGADVLRIGGPHLPVVEPLLDDANLGKRWAEVDLRRERGRAELLELVAGGDVVVQGYRPGSLAGLGVGPDDLFEARPGLVYAGLSAYSHLGPWAKRRGFDSLVQTASGIGAAGAEAAGEPGTRPLPAQALDHGAGWLLAFGIITALRRRADEGGSWRVRTSLVQVSAFLQALGRVDALDVEDPTVDDVLDLLTTTAGNDRVVGHVSLPGRIAERDITWDRPGSVRGADPLEWATSR
jgi:crotonobetainyl-CoA:carnitine CoA-transferase CaiB-like acyl-CoA transferase